MSISKYSAEEKAYWVSQFRRSHMSIRGFLNNSSVSIHWSTLSRWIHLFERDGIDGLRENRHWNKYSSKLQQQVITDYLAGNGSLETLTIRYGLRSSNTVSKWISRYNGTNKSTILSSGKQVPIMARKTTFEERVKITEYAIAHDRNYSKTSAKYNVSYQQVRLWVQKVDRGGFPALKDHRGHHKSVNELTEIERLRLENRRLTAELNDKKAIEAFAKKLLALRTHKK